MYMESYDRCFDIPKTEQFYGAPFFPIQNMWEGPFPHSYFIEINGFAVGCTTENIVHYVHESQEYRDFSVEVSTTRGNIILSITGEAYVTLSERRVEPEPLNSVEQSYLLRFLEAQTFNAIDFNGVNTEKNIVGKDLGALSKQYYSLASQTIANTSSTKINKHKMMLYLIGTYVVEGEDKSTSIKSLSELLLHLSTNIKYSRGSDFSFPDGLSASLSNLCIKLAKQI
jgi:hypothetical protein